LSRVLKSFSIFVTEYFTVRLALYSNGVFVGRISIMRASEIL